MRRLVITALVVVGLCAAEANAAGPVAGPRARPFCSGLRGLSTNSAADLTGKANTYSRALRVLKREKASIKKHCRGVTGEGLSNVQPVAHPGDPTNKEWLLVIGFVSAGDIPTGNWDLALDGVRLRLIVQAIPQASSAGGVVHASCPAKVTTPASSDDPATRAALVPTGAVAVLLCRYRGLNPAPRRVGTLAAVRLVTAPRIVGPLTRRFDALPQPPPGVHSCPASDDSKLIAFFQYADVADDPVVVELNGCGFVGNGHVGRWLIGDPSNGRLDRQLRTLTHCVRPSNLPGRSCRD